MILLDALHLQLAFLEGLSERMAFTLALGADRLVAWEIFRAMAVERSQFGALTAVVLLPPILSILDPMRSGRTVSHS